MDISPKNTPQSNITKKIKPIVLLQHGALGSSNIWIMFGSERSLAYSLADAGYDVWLGNARGNIYGQDHMNLTRMDKEFWEFSIEEIALYDFPAIIDYILNYTKSERLYMIGHSMGCTASYILLSMKPDYNEKLHLLVSLAPIAYWKKSFTPPLIQFISENNFIIRMFLETIIGITIEPNAFWMKLFLLTCSNESFAKYFCIFVTSQVFGLDYSHINITDIMILYNHYPSGGPNRIFLHYAQNIIAENFKQYDYRYENNFKQYKQDEPQEYDLTKITTPVALIYANNDTFIHKECLIELYNRLPNVPIFEAVQCKYFSHIDFVLAKNLKTVVNDRIARLLKEYSE
ncbi:hypothetical protein M0802_004254 [Mischocyttarus mexicanus]|nr:hypothetical protein M0802_004254 [Mischocyttarus mexicanus]